MSMVRVAVASTDGSAIDQSLHEASLFSIYDVSPESFLFVEQRWSTGTSGSGSVRKGSSDLTVDDLLDLISDCSLLLVRSFGVEAGGKMKLGWITVYEAEMPVEKALKKLSRSPLFINAFDGKANGTRRTGMF